MQTLMKLGENQGVRRIKGLYLLLVGAAVAVQFVAVAAYNADAGLDDAAYNVWQVLDVLMVIGIVFVLVISLKRKIAVGSGDGVTREYLESNVNFYLAAAIGIGLASNWIRVEFTEGWNDFLWILIAMILPPLFISNGIRLLRSGNTG